MTSNRNTKLYKITNLIVEIRSRGEILTKRSKPYEVQGRSKEGTVNIFIVPDFEEFERNKDIYPHLTAEDWEYIRTGFAFYDSILDFNGFGLHASALAMDDRAVLFSGPCGIGKSTHTRLWQQRFGKSKVVIINDDKPALRLENDIIYAYGTPWSGKNDLHKNIRVPLEAIVFLKQSQENRIRRLGYKEGLRMLIYQSLCPRKTPEKMDKLLTLIELVLKKIPVYQLDCNIGFQAVGLAYNRIFAWE